MRYPSFVVQAAFAVPALLLTIAASQAADMALKTPPPMPSAPSSWFVEGDIGASFGIFDDLKHLNPLGVGVALSPTSGNYILLNNKSLDSTSWTGGASVGYFFNQTYFGKLTYQYFGRFNADGFDLFPAPFGNARQALTDNAQGLLAGIGADYNLSPQVFIEPVVQIGVGFLHATAIQTTGVGTSSFPSQNNINFIAGGGLGIGYRATSTLDLILSGNYYWLGRGDSGTTGNPPPANMNPGEQLQGNLSVITATVGGRWKF